MKQKLTVSFEETQKGCNANVKLEVEDEDPKSYDNDIVLKEAQRLYDEACKFSKQKTVNKM